MSLERIGIPEGGGTTDRNTRCPGAYLSVDREGFRELARHGHPWASGIEDLPAEGRGSARTFCAGDVSIVVRHHGSYAMGLCSRCSDMEANQRKDLRDRQMRQQQTVRR